MTDKSPVVAVLPFATPGRPSDLVLSRGLVEDISGELTRFRALGVVSPASGAVVAELPDREAGERLGASHLLRGSLRRHNGSIQVRIHLVECASGAQLWTDTIDVPETDLVLAEGDVAARITASLATRLEGATLAGARRKAVASLDVYELTVRGLALLREGTLDADEEARALFRQALDQDPNFARAHAGISLSWFNEWSCQYWSLFEENGRRVYRAAHKALALDDRDAMLHLVIGRICLYRREFEQAAWYVDRALALCPNDAELLIQLSLADTLLGRSDLAVAHAARAMRLNPYHPNFYYAYAALAHLVARDLGRSVELFAKADRAPFVDWAAHGAILFAHRGQLPEARRQLEIYHAEFERMIAPTSDLSPVEWFLQVSAYRRPEDREFMLEGLRLAGEAVDDAAGIGSGMDTAQPRPGLPATAARPDPAGSEAPPARPNLFAEQGDVWQLEYAGRRATVGDLKGLHDLRRLLSHPREPIHSLDLSGRGADSYRGDEMLDERARHEIRRRVRHLQEDIDEADGNHDLDTASRARAEMETLLQTLSDSLGLNGRNRRLNDAAERARSAVTWRIRHAIKKVSATHPELGRHLSNSVRTGIFCTYQPERPTHWRTDGARDAPSPA